MTVALAVALLACGLICVVCVKRTPDRDDRGGLCFAPREPDTVVERTYLFADLVGFTAIAEIRGDVAAAHLADRFTWLVRRSLRGRAELVKTMGDGVFVCSEDTADAVLTALTLHDLVAAETALPPVTAGLHRGRAVALGGDYLGAAVNVAARVLGEAAPGQIACTDAVACHLADHPRILLEPVGVAHFRNVSESSFLYRITAARVTTLQGGST